MVEWRAQQVVGFEKLGWLQVQGVEPVPSWAGAEKGVLVEARQAAPALQVAEAFPWAVQALGLQQECLPLGGRVTGMNKL